MPIMSIRALINFRIIASVVLILIFSAIIAIWQARNSVEDEVRSSINLAVQMMEFGLSQLSSNSDESDAWIEKITHLQAVRHLHISVNQHASKNSNNSLSNANNSKASAPKWFINAVMLDFVTHNYNIKIADGTIKPIFITANPLDEINEAWGETKAFFWSIVLMISIIFITVNLVFNTMLKAVKTILSGLREIQSGHFNYVLPTFTIREFNAIAVEINSMSSALKLAQQSNQALALKTMQIQEKERKEMSCELHDEMGQSLTAIKAMAVTCQNDNTNVKEITRAIVDICDHLSLVVRSMMKTLHPLSLSELGLGATLTELVAEWQRRSTGLQFNLDYSAKLDNLNPDTAIHVYRIVQECLTNVVRHANATIVTISVHKHKDVVNICVADNGQGKQANSIGFGLLSMRERAENLGGTFDLESKADKGLKIMVQLPYKESE